jgi:hypothetical protein
MATKRKQVVAAQGARAASVPPIDPRIVGLLRNHLAKLDGADPKTKAIPLAQQHVRGCPRQCAVREDGRRAEACAIARAIIAIATHQAHVGDRSIVRLVERVAAHASMVRADAGKVRRAVETYTGRVAPVLHHYPAIRSAGSTAGARAAMTKLVHDAERGRWAPAAPEHDHALKCEEPFAVLREIGEHADRLDAFAERLRSAYGTGVAEQRPVEPGRQRGHFTARRVIAMLDADGVRRKDIARLLDLTQQQVHELCRPPRRGRGRVI